MSKNRFVTDQDLIKIDLGEGDWVKVPARISYKMATQFQASAGNEQERVTNMMLYLIREWSLIDPNTNEVATIDQPHIEMLDVATVKEIMEHVAPILTVEKKRLETSDSQ